MFVQNLTKARYYQFTVPEGLGAWISKAGFSKVGTEGKLGDDGTTDVISQLSTLNSQLSDVWYSLDGRKLNAKPTTKGIYIMNGKKVVMK